MSTTDAGAPTTSAATTLIAVEPAASVAEPALAAATTVTGARIAAPSWDYSPLADHLSLDAVNDARMQAPNPATIRIPRLEVEASIIPLGLNDDGSIEVPEDPDQAGCGWAEPETMGGGVPVSGLPEEARRFFYLQS